MAGSQWVGLELGTCMLAWCLAVACVRACVRSHAHVMHSSMWAGLGMGTGDDGLRIWADQVEGIGHDRIGQAGQAQAGRLRWFSSGR